MTSTSELKEIAISFLQQAAAGKLDQAYALVAHDFSHHNPWFANGAEALKAGMRESAAVHPGKIFDVQRAIAEGDLVAVHSRVKMPGTAVAIAVVHIFRFEHGLIAELWDIGQAQPESMVNELGMF